MGCTKLSRMPERIADLPPSADAHCVRCGPLRWSSRPLRSEMLLGGTAVAWKLVSGARSRGAGAARTRFGAGAAPSSDEVFFGGIAEIGYCL